jgi:hypothetical protein
VAIEANTRDHGVSVVVEDVEAKQRWMREQVK